jgi:hypothetical protein
MKARHHMTVRAHHAESRGRGRVSVWNEAGNLELMMTPSELRKMERLTGEIIDDVISNELMGSLLNYYRDSGLLIDSDDLQRL